VIETITAKEQAKRRNIVDITVLITVADSILCLKSLFEPFSPSCFGHNFDPPLGAISGNSLSRRYEQNDTSVSFVIDNYSKSTDPKNYVVISTTAVSGRCFFIYWIPVSIAGLLLYIELWPIG